MELSAAVEEFVRLVAERPAADDAELAEALIACGLSVDDAERIVAFVPLACGRQMLSPSGPRFSDAYEIRDPDSGRSARGTISTEPAYQAALNSWQQHGGDELVIRVAGLSAEVRVARQLAPDGRLDKVVLTEPVFLRIPLPAAAATPTPARWWRRWTGFG